MPPKKQKGPTEPSKVGITWSDERFGWITRAVLLDDRELLVQLEYFEDRTSWQYSFRLHRTAPDAFEGSWSCSDGAGKSGPVTATIHSGPNDRVRLQGTWVEGGVATTWETDDLRLERISSDDE
ncbi:MAG: hypothetical protein U0791_25470 [Gemmataceae bacterium]